MLARGSQTIRNEVLSQPNPFLREARAKLLEILGDEHLTDEVLKIVIRAMRETERRERVAQWREGGKIFY